MRANAQARDAGRTQKGVEIRYYTIIYDLVDDVKAAMSGLLTPERARDLLGYAKILEVFKVTKVGKVAGCLVTEGVARGAGVRLLRDNVVIHEGKLKTLKRFKDEVQGSQAGQECGMAFENYEDIRAGDVIECYRVERCSARSESKSQARVDPPTSAVMPAQSAGHPRTSCEHEQDVDGRIKSGFGGRMTQRTMPRNKEPSRQARRRPPSASCASAN